MKIYLDTSVLNVYLFGEYSEVEADRFPVVSKLFELINSKKVRAIVSLYSLQEIFSFCKGVFSPDEAGYICKDSLLTLLKNDFELSGLLSREEHLLHKARFKIDDLSDQPHAISAYLNQVML